MAQGAANLGGGVVRRPMTGGQAVVAVLVAGACGVALLWCGLPEAWSPVGQWDFDAYYYALKVKDAGGNPWDHAEVIKAAGGWVSPPLYPPHTLEFFRLLAFNDIYTAKLVFLAAKLGCLAALFAVWLMVFVRPGARGWDADMLWPYRAAAGVLGMGDVAAPTTWRSHFLIVPSDRSRVEAG